MPEAAASPILEFDRVSISFDEVPVLRELCFRVQAGETLVIFGAAGSGKSVLLKCALGLLRPDKGTIRVFGKQICGMPESELNEVRSRIGMAFQESALFDSLNVEDNVAYPLRNHKRLLVPEPEVLERTRSALRFVELEHTLEKFPSELSGGMRRRVAIARAVVTEPPLLLYDSPTAGLDPITANTIIALIIKERDLSGATTLTVTHRYQDGTLMANYRYDVENQSLIRVTEPAELAALRTRFLVLREGELVFEGSQAELEASKDAYTSKFVTGRRSS